MKKNRDINYRPTPEGVWEGRCDGWDRLHHRWHQRVERIDLNAEPDLENSVVMLGFVCDVGVRRNHGRAGAKEGPLAIRKMLGNLPVHFSPQIRLLDAGNIYCVNDDLELAQATLADAVDAILKAQGFPLLLGGGHEITFGHYMGIRKSRGNRNRIGIINIDAHLDIREPDRGLGSSGTGFFQIAQECERGCEPFNYLALGIQEISNTQALFRTAERNDVEIISVDAVHQSSEQISIINRIRDFSQRVDDVYLTVDLDAFAAAYAPGVSAPAFSGITPDHTFMKLFDFILALPNLSSFDIAELNPHFDTDNRTVRLASDLIFRLLARRK